MLIRSVDPENDAAQILEIYAPFVSETAVSFEEQVPSLQEFSDRIRKIAARFPYLVLAGDDGTILGFAYATTHRERAAYRWVVESSIYMRPDSRGKNLAPNLYAALCDVLSKRNFSRAYAIITLPNESSKKFHEKMGFIEFALFENAGYKNEAWHNVLWMRKTLAPFLSPSPEPVFEISSL